MSPRFPLKAHIGILLAKWLQTDWIENLNAICKELESDITDILEYKKD